jgi:L-asparaginase
LRSKIKIFITGGTFDKEYNEITGKLYFKNSHMYELLELGRSKLDVDIETLMMVDSIDMSDTERNYIVQKCIDETSKQIVITHGTDTMVKTANLLADANIKKNIILTGAMIPVKFGSSDGLFNMGSALSFVQALPVGVYIAMNGKIFTHTNVKKNIEMGIFEKLETLK